MATEPAATTTTPPPAAAEKPIDWMSGMTDEMKGYVQNKGWKGVQELAFSYLNLEKLRGVPEERLLKLPESMDAPEARAVWERLGTPKEAKDYGLDPKTVGEHLAQDFLEIGVPKDMAAKIVAKHAARAAEIAEKTKENQKAELATSDQALKKEWGMAYDQNRAIVDSAARNLGISTEEVQSLGQALGMDKAMKFLHRLGTATSEAPYVGGQAAANGVLAPEQARQKIKDLRGDSSFIDKLMRGDVEAKKLWQRAHEMAHPGDTHF